MFKFKVNKAKILSAGKLIHSLSAQLLDANIYIEFLPSGAE